MVFFLRLIIFVFVYQINVSIIMFRLKLLSYDQLLLTFFFQFIMGQKPSDILFGEVNFEFICIITPEGSFTQLLILILVFKWIYVLNE